MKPIVRFGLSLALITAGELVVFNHYNSLFTAKAVQAEKVVVAARNAPTQLSGIQLLNDQVAAVSNDGSTFAYIDANNVLHVLDTASHKEIYKLQLGYTPIFLKWIVGDYLFIGTEDMSGGLKNLRLSTIEVGTGTVRLINNFSGFLPQSTFKKVSFSPYTNDVYILIGGPNATILYHYGTNSSGGSTDLTTIDLGGRYVTDVSVTSTTNQLYFQDLSLGTPNLLVYENHQVSLIQRNSALLRVLNDTMYYGTLDSQGLVTAVYRYEKGTGTKILQLPAPTSPKNVFINQQGQIITTTSHSFTNQSTHKTTHVNSTDTLINAGNALFDLASNGKLTVYM